MFLAGSYVVLLLVSAGWYCLFIWWSLVETNRTLPELRRRIYREFYILVPVYVNHLVYRRDLLSLLLFWNSLFEIY